ncbi:hypothetical protein ACSBR2_031472 [Camellia fascicularis]
MDRNGDNRYDNNSDSRHLRPSRAPLRSSTDAPINHRRRRSPDHHHHHHHHHHRPFESPPSGGNGGGFRPTGGGGFNSNHQIPLSGQKRGFPFSARGASPDRSDVGNFAKLFVGSVPRTATEEDIRPLFEEHGHVLEVALIKDKRTGQQQGCCFVKYTTSEEADRAMSALHNQHTLPGGVGPIQVRYADGERERLGAVEYKLFVGALNKQATEKEVEEIFSPYGRVEEVYLMRDEMKQSRGCGFVKFFHREMAMAAINALNGIYTMKGCDQPLIVRFADPKRPRAGDPRASPAFGGPGFGPRFPPPEVRPTPNLGEPMHGHKPSDSWHFMSPLNMGPFSNPGVQGFGSQFLPRSGDMAVPSTLGGPLGVHNGSVDGVLSGCAVSSSTSQQSFNQSLPQVPSIGQQQISQVQRPLQSPPELPSFMQTQTPLQQHGQLQIPQSAGQTPFSHALLGLGGQLFVSQPQVQQNASSAQQAPMNTNLPPHHPSAAANEQQLPLQQSASQFAQMLSQQKQTLQASFQSSQQAFSQLQQQFQLIQPSNQNLMSHQFSQATKQQYPWAGIVPQTVASVPAITSVADVPPATSSAPVLPQAVAPAKCNWTEHTSPDGFKYYYNSSTGQSTWEKPEELALFEQQQKQSVQQPQTQSHPQRISTQQVPQTQQFQLQTQVQTQAHHPQQLQQSSLPSLYQASGVTGHQNILEQLGYTQLQMAAGSVNDPARFQQGLQAAQDWMWKNTSSGT